MKTRTGLILFQVLGVTWLIFTLAFLVAAVWSLIDNLTGTSDDVSSTVVRFVGTWGAFSLLYINRLRTRALKTKIEHDEPSAQN